MTRLTRFIARLYPPSWREHYGDEFDALLEDVDADWLDALNVLKGALAMHIRYFGMIAVCFAATGALVAGIVAYRLPDKYVSSDVVNVSSVGAVNDAANPALIRRLVDRALSEESLSALIRGKGLYDYKGDSDQRSLHALTYRLRQATEIELGDPVPGATSTKLTIRFTYRTALGAQRVTGDMARLIMEAAFSEQYDSPSGASTEQSLLAEALRIVDLAVLDNPTLPTQPQSPRRVFVVGFGCAIGLLVGIVVAWIRQGLPRTA